MRVQAAFRQATPLRNVVHAGGLETVFRKLHHGLVKDLLDPHLRRQTQALFRFEAHFGRHIRRSMKV